jgi:hypothetical protein
MHDNPAHWVVSSERTILFLPPERELFAQADGFEYVLRNVLGCIVLPNPRPNCATLSRATYDKRSAAALGNSRATKETSPRRSAPMSRYFGRCMKDRTSTLKTSIVSLGKLLAPKDANSFRRALSLV